jgi:hypothetical protein
MISYQRINLDISEMDIKEMLKKDKEFMHSIKNPKEGTDEVPIIIQLT